MSWTKPRTRDIPRRADAAGLYDTTRNELHVFRHYIADRPLPCELTIGRSRAADITVSEFTISSQHAIVECRDGRQVWIRECSESTEIDIDGHRIDGPARLLVGMEVWLGDTLFMATDEHGTFPLLVNTMDELAWKAHKRLNSTRVAGSWVGRSHTTVSRYSNRYERQHANASTHAEESSR